MNWAVVSGLLSPSALVIGVTVPPGATALTLIPSLANSHAADLVSPTTPCLAIVYTCGPSPPTTPAVLARDTIAPLPCGCIALAACLIPKNTARDRIAIVWSKASALVSIIEPMAPTTPALLTMPVKEPNSF